MVFYLSFVSVCSILHILVFLFFAGNENILPPFLLVNDPRHCLSLSGFTRLRTPLVAKDRELIAKKMVRTKAHNAAARKSELTTQLEAYPILLNRLTQHIPTSVSPSCGGESSEEEFIHSAQSYVFALLLGQISQDQNRWGRKSCEDLANSLMAKRCPPSQ